ncbi:ORF135 [Ranid herpesvirus 2]|uniref:ORF135 n=1 Tax=Ranid herpesvirus 2 TaxID=389214 RepID=Q14VX1_9VIRU|nr:ORF135 [Ranid herpesvirus 2]ABG25598.1 ORF135 [Ranid herpesvirus 2]
MQKKEETAKRWRPDEQYMDAAQRAYAAGTLTTPPPDQKRFSRRHMLPMLYVEFFPGSTRRYHEQDDFLWEMALYYGRSIKPIKDHIYDGEMPNFDYQCNILKHRMPPPALRVKDMPRVEVYGKDGQRGEKLPNVIYVEKVEPERLEALNKLWLNKPPVPTWRQAFKVERLPLLSGDVTDDIHCFASKEHVHVYLELIYTALCQAVHICFENYLLTEFRETAEFVLHSLRLCGYFWQKVQYQAMQTSLADALLNHAYVLWVNDHVVVPLRANQLLRRIFKKIILYQTYPWREAESGNICTTIRDVPLYSAPERHSVLPVSHRAVYEMLKDRQQYADNSEMNHFRELWAVNRAAYECGVLQACCVTDYQTYARMRAEENYPVPESVAAVTLHDAMMHTDKTPTVERMMQSSLMADLYHLDALLDRNRKRNNVLPCCMSTLPPLMDEVVYYCMAEKNNRPVPPPSYASSLLFSDRENAKGKRNMARQLFCISCAWKTGQDHVGGWDFITQLWHSKLCSRLRHYDVENLRQTPKDIVSYKGTSVSQEPF